MGFLEVFRKRKTQERGEAQSQQEILEGYTYLYESLEWQSFYALIPEVAKKRKTLCVTGKCPEKLRIGDAEAIWITNIETEYKSALPERLEFELTQEVLQFMKNNFASSVFVDDIEFLTVCNDFEKTMEYLKTLTDSASSTKASVIVHIAPGFFSAKEISLLKSIFDCVLTSPNKEVSLEPNAHLLSRMPYQKIASIVNSLAPSGRKLIISPLRAEKLIPFFGKDNDYYFLTSTEQNIPVVRPWATETDFIITLKNYIARGGKVALIDGLECVYSSLNFKQFLSFIKDITDIAARERIKIFCILNESIIKNQELLAIKQRFDKYVSQ